MGEKPGQREAMDRYMGRLKRQADSMGSGVTESHLRKQAQETARKSNAKDEARKAKSGGTKRIVTGGEPREIKQASGRIFIDHGRGKK